jgi:hypothetical protein
MDKQTREKTLLGLMVTHELKLKLGLLAGARDATVTKVVTTAIEHELNAALDAHEFDAAMYRAFGGAPVKPLNEVDLQIQVLAKLKEQAGFDALAKAENPLVNLPLGSFDVLGKVKK